MKDLSVSQSYLLCSLNQNGKLPALSIEAPICLLAGGLIDLMFAKRVLIGADKKLCVSAELGEEMRHLQSLYTYLKESKPMKVDQLTNEYVFTFSDKRLNLLVQEIGSSLADLGCVTAKPGSSPRKPVCFLPNADAVDTVIQNIRAELLEDGAVSDNIIALVSLMEKSGQIKPYFSKYEKDQLKTRLKEMRQSDSHKLADEMVTYIECTLAAIIAVSGAGH